MRPRRQPRTLALLGKSLTGQDARLLSEEAVDGGIRLPQRTLAAMLAVHRPSLDKFLKGLERERLVRVGYSEIEILHAEGLVRAPRSAVGVPHPRKLSAG